MRAQVKAQVSANMRAKVRADVAHKVRAEVMHMQPMRMYPMRIQVLQLRAAKANVLQAAEDMFHAYDTDRSGGLIVSEVAAMLDGNGELSEQVIH